jgi:hypothetical protein
MSNRIDEGSSLMRLSYASYMSLGILAAFMVFATAAFTLGTVVDLTLALGIVFVVVSTGLAYQYRHDLISFATSAGIAALGGWMIVSSQLFSRGTVDDLSFASALAICVLAAIGLTANELRAERVVHSLEVREHVPGAA